MARHLPQIDQSSSGLALIITNDYRHSGSTMTPLDGTHKDGAKMKEVLNELNYTVIAKKNLSCSEMQRLLYEASQIQYPRSFCSVIVVFSGHGTADEDRKLSYVFSQDCVQLLVKDLVDPFMPKNSPANGTIHKVFLIDACLGTRKAYDSSVPIAKGGVTTSKGGEKVQTIDVPPEGNCILAHSTSIGYQSFEVKQKEISMGGLWLDALSQVIRDNCHSMSVGDILSETNRYLINKKYQERAFKAAMTQPHFISTAYGPVRLIPQQLPPVPDPKPVPLPGEPDPILPGVGIISKGQYSGRLNSMQQSNKIYGLIFEDHPKTRNGFYLAKVSFIVTATGQPKSFSSSAEKRTLEMAREEAARVACKRIDVLVIPIINHQNQLQRLKEGCEAQKPQLSYTLQEIKTNVQQKFQFQVTVKNSDGMVLCTEIGSVQGSKQHAKHAAASKANIMMKF